MGYVREILKIDEMNHYLSQWVVDSWIVQELGRDNLSQNERIFLGCCYVMGYQGDYGLDMFDNVCKELGINDEKMMRVGLMQVWQGSSDS